MRIALFVLIVSVVSMGQNPLFAPGPQGQQQYIQGAPQGQYFAPGQFQQGPFFPNPQGNPYMAPGVYHSHFSQGGGQYGPSGSNQWNNQGSSTVIVQPPLYIPYPVVQPPVMVPYPVVHPVPIYPAPPYCHPPRPPVYCYPRPRCNPCGPYFNYGVQFGF